MNSWKRCLKMTLLRDLTLSMNKSAISKIAKKSNNPFRNKWITSSDAPDINFHAWGEIKIIKWIFIVANVVWKSKFCENRCRLWTKRPFQKSLKKSNNPFRNKLITSSDAPDMKFYSGGKIEIVNWIFTTEKAVGKMGISPRHSQMSAKTYRNCFSLSRNLSNNIQP